MQNSLTSKTISIVIPFFNEENSIERFFKEIKQVLNDPSNGDISSPEIINSIVTRDPSENTQD